MKVSRARCPIRKSPFRKSRDGQVQDEGEAGDARVGGHVPDAEQDGRRDAEQLFSLAGGLSDDNGKMDPYRLSIWVAISANYKIFMPSTRKRSLKGTWPNSAKVVRSSLTMMTTCTLHVVWLAKKLMARLTARSQKLSMESHCEHSGMERKLHSQVKWGQAAALLQRHPLSRGETNRIVMGRNAIGTAYGTQRDC